jgi:hypothetical protein
VYGPLHPEPARQPSDPSGPGGDHPPDPGPSEPEVMALADSHLLSAESLASAYRRCYPDSLVLSFASAAECAEAKPDRVATLLLYDHDGDVLNEALLQDVRALRDAFRNPIFMVLSDAENATDRAATEGLLRSGADLVISARTTPLDEAFSILDRTRAAGARSGEDPENSGE